MPRHRFAPLMGVCGGAGVGASTACRKAFLDGIPDILAFARQALQASLEKEYPKAVPVSVGDIGLTLTLGTNSAVELANKSFNPAGFRDATRARTMPPWR
ncbi:hypothetical protein QNM99_00505 [Pseudomonas sp. PCH446]